MNIILVSHCNFFGQSAYHVHSIAKELKARGCACVICVPFWAALAAQNVTPVVPIIDYDTALEQGLVFPDGNAPALIHCWTPREHVRQFTQAIADRYGCPYVVHLEDNEFEILNRTLKSQGHEEIDNIHTQTQNSVISPTLVHPVQYWPFMRKAVGITVLIDRLLEHIPNGIPGLVFWPGYDEIFCTIPTFIQSELRKKYGVSDEAFVMLYCGAFTAVNEDEVRQMLLAFALLKRQGMPLHFIKTGANILPDILEQTGLNVFMSDLGLLPRNQLPELLAIADALIQPGTCDAFNDYRFPSKLPEALISGKPVILPRTNLGRFLVDGVDAVITETGQTDELVNKIRTLYENPELRRFIGANGQVFARERLQWGIAAEKILAFYNEQCLPSAFVANRNIYADNLKQNQGLKYVVMERDTKITVLNHTITERDARITDLNQTAADRDAQIAILNGSIFKRDAQIATLNQVVSERDVQITAINCAISDRDVRITVLDQAVADRDGQTAGLIKQISDIQATITAIYNSTSWRVTIPLRFARTGIKSISRRLHSIISESLRALYHIVPLTDENKSRLKSSVYKYLGVFIKNTKSYQHWQMNQQVLLTHASAPSKASEIYKTDRSTPEDSIGVIKQFNNRRTTITAFVPYNFMPQTFGGAVRISNVYGSLSKYFNINLVGVVGYGDSFQVHETNDNLTVYLVPMSKPFYNLLISEQNKSDGLLHDILLVNEYRMIPELIEICNLLRSKTDIFITTQPYFIKMLLEFCSDKMLVYEAENVDHDLKKSYFKNPYHNETAKQYLETVREAEALACQRSDFIVGVSGEDVDKLCSLYSVRKDKIVMVPNGIDVYACHYISTRERIINKDNIRDKRKHVVFVGSAHGPNIEAVDYILSEIANKNNNIKYTIIGNINSAFNDRDIPPNVHFTGMITEEAKVNVYKTADLAINAMFSGSGTNLKVLEYLAYGIPLVSTEFGMRGFGVFNIYIYYAQKDNFLEIIEKTLSLPAAIVEANALEARRLCEEHFDKAVITLGLIDHIKEIEKRWENKRNKYRIAIDGRILHRNISGSERYIYHLMKNISGKKHENDYQYCLVNNSGFKIDGISNIPNISLSDKIDLFHKTYQVSHHNDLLELLNSRKSVFSFLDLILCKNPDYFEKKEDYDNFVALMGLAFKYSDRIIAISEHAKRDVVENFNIPEEKVEVVYLGLDLDKFRLVSDKKEIEDFRTAYKLPDKYLLYIGTDYPHKNLKNLYIAFSIIMNLPEMKDYFLVTAGNSSYRKGQGYLSAYLEPIKHRIVSLGHFADDKIHLLYNAAAISVFPSLYEGFGLTVLEAFACGVPLICSDATSLPEVAGDAAYMVDAKDPEQIAKAIVDVVTNSQLRDMLITRGLERVKQFTWNKCAENTHNIYKKVLLELRDDGRDNENILRLQ